MKRWSSKYLAVVLLLSASFLSACGGGGGGGDVHTGGGGGGSSSIDSNLVGTWDMTSQNGSSTSSLGWGGTIVYSSNGAWTSTFSGSCAGSSESGTSTTSNNTITITVTTSNGSCADSVGSYGPYSYTISGTTFTLYANHTDVFVKRGSSGGGTPQAVTVRKVPDTGQTAAYTTTFGEDSDYTINPPSYTDNGNGTITDNVTGLIWQKCSVGKTWSAGSPACATGTATTHNWYEATGTADATYNAGGATNVCGSLTLAGFTDWRLPNTFELQGIVNYGTYNPAINSTYFPAVVSSSFYWSAPTNANYTSSVWLVHFSNGDLRLNSRSNDFYVRCVSGSTSTPSFTDNGDGTITDNLTTMMWQKCSEGQTWSAGSPACATGSATTVTWEGAITYCEGLSLAGNSDWRLPNVKELRSIVDDTVSNPAINRTYFPAVVSSFYWSATTNAGSTSDAWHVEFSYGGVRSNFITKSNSIWIRCVRLGQ